MKGTLEAADTGQARQILEEMKLDVQELEAAPSEAPSTPIGRNEFLLFNQQLASITKAGIPLEQGLRQLARDAGSHRMQRLIESVAGDLETGTPIEQAVEKHKEAFPPLYSRILRAGIETGRLSEMLTSLNRHLEIGQRTARIIYEALAYPVVVFVLAITIISGIMYFIIPTFAEVLSDMSNGNYGLPVLTLFILNLSRHILPIWIGTISVILVLIFFFKSLAYSRSGRMVKENILSAVPVLGRIAHAGSLSRLSDSLALLISAGCAMPQGLRLAGQASGSEHVNKEAELLAGQIEQGSGLMDAGHLCRTIPMLFLYSVQLGAQRNELQDHLYSLGQMYAQQTRCMQARLQAFLAPLLIILLGVMVGTIVLAMFLPMIKIIQVLM